MSLPVLRNFALWAVFAARSTSCMAEQGAWNPPTTCMKSIRSHRGSASCDESPVSDLNVRRFHRSDNISLASLARRHSKKQRNKSRLPSHIFDVRCGGNSEDFSDGGVEGEVSNRLDESMDSEETSAASPNEKEDCLPETSLDVGSGEEDNHLNKTYKMGEEIEAAPSEEIMDESLPLEGKQDSTSLDDSSQSDEISADESTSDAKYEGDISKTSGAQTETIPSEILEKQSKLRSSASVRRAEGKLLHDAGNLIEAAEAFRDAASMLNEAIQVSSNYITSDRSEDEESIVVERATCRLHEALCLLKDGRPGDCVEACTDVLDDGVTVVPLEEETENSDPSPPTAVVKIIPPPTNSNGHPVDSRPVPPPIRARAHHRRAKARLALGDLDGALEDARSAAFMGDKNAVAFYGRLMREGSGAADGSGEGSHGLGDSSSPFGGMSNPLLDGLLGGNGPLMSPGAGSGDFSASLFSSLLNSSNESGGNPLGIMGDLFSPSMSDGRTSRRKGKNGSGGMDTLAKSVLSSLMKRIEDKETQETICRYLHSADASQVMQFSSMAGVPMTEENAGRLVSFASGVTPKSISGSISKIKRGLAIVKTLRKILKVIDKYKPIIVLAILIYWIRSALLEPYPVNKKQATKLAQKAAMSLALF